jgi:hypothetical protein
MYRVKQLFGGSLTQRDYDGQVAEALAMARPEQNDKGRYARKRSSCLKTQPDTERFTRNLIYTIKPQSGLGCFFRHAIHILYSVLMFPSEVTLLYFVVGGEAKTLSSVSPASNRAYSL